MNQELQKTDAIADAVEIPEGAQYVRENTYGQPTFAKHDYYWYIWIGSDWIPTFWNRHNLKLPDDFKPL